MGGSKSKACATALGCAVDAAAHTNPLRQQVQLQQVPAPAPTAPEPLAKGICGGICGTGTGTKTNADAPEEKKTPYRVVRRKLLTLQPDLESPKNMERLPELINARTIPLQIFQDHFQHLLVRT
jgi:uncharacterized low-complexity protein